MRCKRFGGAEGIEGAIAEIVSVQLGLDRNSSGGGSTEDRLTHILKHPALKEAILSESGPEFFSMLHHQNSNSTWHEHREELFDLSDTVAEAGPAGLEFVNCFDVLSAISSDDDAPRLEQVRLRMVARIEQEIGKLKSEPTRNEKQLEQLNQQNRILDSAAAKGELIGSAAPELDFIWSSDEGLKAWSNLQDKAFVIDFWTPSCAPCVADLPKLAKLKSLLGDDFVLIGVTSVQGFMPLKSGFQMCDEVDRECELMKEYITDREITWPVIYTKQSVFNSDYGVRGVPHMVVVDSKGIIRDGFNPAAMSLDSIYNRINSAMQNR